MDDDIDHLDAPSPTSESWQNFWSSTFGFWLAVGLVVAAASTLFFGQLSDLGIWEPWEASEIFIAQEYQDRPAPPSESELGPREKSYNWAVPTQDRKPVERSFLKTWLMAQTMPVSSSGSSSFEVGTLEFMARLPMALALFAVTVLGFFWLRRRFSTWPALLAMLGFASTPVVYMGLHSVATEMLFVATTTGAILAFVELMYAEGWWRYLWGALYGLALGLAFLDQRFLGLILPLTVIVAFGVTQLPFRRVARLEEQLERDTPILGWPQIAGCVASILAAIGVLVWATFRSSGAPADTWFLPHVEQLVAVFVPLCLLSSGLAAAWNTRVVERFRSPAGLLGLGVAAACIIPLLEAYADANPTLIKNGHVVDKIPVLTYALENHVFGEGFPNGHMHFALWIRELGFSLIPWVVLVPLGVGYLARSTRLSDESGALREDVLSEAESTRRLLLVWSFISVAVVAGGSVYGHFFYPAYFPLLAGVGLMFADTGFWRWARRETLLPYFMGFSAIAIVLMLTKDLSRWPARLIETYMMFQRDVGLPDGFGYGATLDGLRYTWIGLIAVYFFGLLSTLAVTVEGMPEWPGKFKGALANLWESLSEVARRSRGRSDASPEMSYDTATEETASAAKQRALDKEAFRQRNGIVPAIVRYVETPMPFGALVTAAFLATAGIFLFEVAPELENHLSQRGVFETYTEHADDGETLYRYQVDTRENSVYLRNVASIPSTNAFLERYDQKQRFFAVIPRDQLSELNKQVRLEYGRDEHLPVLDARSSQLLLVSNELEEGEKNDNFVVDAIVEGEPDIQHEVTFKHQGERKRPVFDGRLELVGYSFDREGARRSEDGEVPRYSWGEKAKLTTYFKVRESIPGDKKIFLHVDHPGSRIHGDHDPIGGDFPTSDWLPGDVVKDVYHLQIDTYASAGVYTMYFGFYRGGQRMQVTPRSAHDGGNRIPMGQLRVTGF